MNTPSPIWTLGMMSGTSLDGVDAALVMTDGTRILGFGETGYRAYSDDERKILTAALGKWQDDTSGDVEAATSVIEAAHIELAKEFPQAEIIGFHGQTLAHDPKSKKTHQAGNGANLAQALDTPTAWDFRSEDVSQGGQGAPLAPVFHFALAKMLALKTPVCFVNLGGVGNVTWVNASKSFPQDAGALLAFDTGPANAPINDLMANNFGKPYDQDGQVALTGTVDMPLLEEVFAQDFFEVSPPKSLDRNDFSEILSKLDELEPSDAIATATALAASCVYASQMHLPDEPSRWLISGGGAKNPVLLARLRSALGKAVDPIEAVGFDGDMLEAQAFGYLAARVKNGLPNSFPSTTGVSSPVVGGRISNPT